MAAFFIYFMQKSLGKLMLYTIFLTYKISGFSGMSFL